MLTPEQKKKFLSLARQTIQEHLKKEKAPIFKATENVFLEKRGAFVTLKIDNQLRGCIGYIVADTPLYKTIQEMAVEAAFGDPRFVSLDETEFNKIKIEISILSELKQISDVNEIEIGKHGILIRKGFNSGLLLPQVATEYEWSRNEFLIHACFKAGLPAEAWKDRDIRIYIFSAEVFGE
ncbi:MAG: AmmeMemoRadiSam system protein A [Candidatus Omnitrophica bacterium]|nr:AmmeMemoRadiSam system protein A [Candidatus Omnitrophota bacterium]